MSTDMLEIHVEGIGWVWFFRASEKKSAWKSAYMSDFYAEFQIALKTD